MKNLRSVFLYFIISAIFFMPIKAQTTTDNLSPVDFGNSLALIWRGADMDSAETIWSQWFKLSDYDGNNTTIEIIGTTTITALDTVGGDGDTLIITSNSYSAVVKPQIGYRYTLDSGGSTVLCNIYHYVNYIHPDSLSDWIVADTLVAISVETAGKTEINLNNVKAPYNKIMADNADTGQAGKLNFGIYFTRKEE